MNTRIAPLLSLILPLCLTAAETSITRSPDHPGYWAVNGDTTLLLGGSVEDNLFQIDHLEEHLDLLVRSGGNYVRNVMSSRDPGNLWPFHLGEDGRYDLRQENPDYWERFDRFLAETDRRGIIVQIEVWATFDFYRGNWTVNPFNPQNNINYDAERSKLPTEVPTHPTRTDNPFFESTPKQRALAVVLGYQQAFVDRLLQSTLGYDHVLYCMDNETSVSAEWGSFWANYIRQEARLAGKTVFITEMWDPWDLSHPFHRSTFDHPETYDFVDISQNNHITGQDHWDNGLKQINRLKRLGVFRPVNNIKVYGNDGGRHKTTRNAIESFTQNVLMGCASSRFHRPTSGQGLNTKAQSIIRSLRDITDAVPFFEMAPANHLLTEREPHEAYCRARENHSYLVYFPQGGEVVLPAADRGTLEWVDILSGRSIPARTWRADVNGLAIQAPDADGHWVATIRMAKN